MTDEPKLTYAKVCEIWGTKCDTWPLMDAVRLVHGLFPTALSSTPLTEKQDMQLTIMYEVALTCIGESLSVMNPNAAPGEYRVYPAEFLNWVTKQAGEPPKELTQYVKPAKEKPISKPQARIIRCRAIAELLWAKDEDLTLPELHASEGIKIACKGERVSEKTLRRYVAHLNPNRKSGRRPAKH